MLPLVFFGSTFYTPLTLQGTLKLSQFQDLIESAEKLHRYSSCLDSECLTSDGRGS